MHHTTVLRQVPLHKIIIIIIIMIIIIIIIITIISIIIIISITILIITVVIGALGAVSVSLKEYMKRIGANVSLEVIQKTALLATARILRKVLSL